jgi:hypothetical protein
MWAPKGSRPRAIRQQQFEYAYIFGIFKQLVYFYEPYSTAFFIFIHLNNTIKYFC